MNKKICIVGLGYVGIPVACEFARNGFEVIGIDISQKKVNLINKGIYPLKGEEPEIRTLLKQLVKENKLRASTDFTECKNAGLISISVQTPLYPNTKAPNFTFLMNAVREVAKNMSKGVVIVIESTIPPKTMKDLVLVMLQENSGMKAGKDFYLAHCPERITPNKMLKRLRKHPRVIGGFDRTSSLKTLEYYKQGIKVEYDLCDMLTAEVIKTSENAYRDVQIGFANELALICEDLNVDFWRVRELVNKTVERNIHQAGIGTGGHCIPKDSLLLAYGANCKTGLIIDARKLNESMPKHSFCSICRLMATRGVSVKNAKVLLAGLSYLPDSDDMRNSPSLELHDLLVVQGASVRVYDRFVSDVPNVNLVDSWEEGLKGADILVLGTLHSEFSKLFNSKEFMKDAKRLMRTPLIFDGRNGFDKKMCEELGFKVKGVGK